MVNIVNWVLVNIGLIILFVLGNLGIISAGFLSVAVFGYWFFSIAGLLFFSKFIAKEFYENDKNWSRIFNSKIGGIYDTVIIIIMVYFGYIFLPIFYLLAYFALNIFEDNYNEIKKNDKELKIRRKKIRCL